MTLASSVIGCDVSKSTIDLFDLSTGRHAKIDNTDAALDRFLSPLAGTDVRVAFEATGSYGHALRRALARHDCAGVQINPLHGRRFAQSRGRLAKTDRIDARQLALMAEQLQLPANALWQPRLEDLKALIARRDQVVKMAGDEARRLAQSAPGPLAEGIAEHIAYLRAKAAELFKTIRAQIAGDADLAHRDALLRSIPGIGPIVAATLLALAPELGRTDRSAIAALAGVAPMAHDSGRFQGKRSIAGGRPKVRRMLYIAALSAGHRNSRFGDAYRRLLNSGKPKKVALIAIARKILTTANAILKSETKFAA